MVSLKVAASLLLVGTQLVNAVPLEERQSGCNADNALRNFRSSKHISDSLPFCSQFLGLPLISATVTVPDTVVATVTASVTSFVTATTTSAYVSQFTILQKRAISTPAFIAQERYPASRISSACNCLTIPLSTSTATVKSGAVTVTSTVAVPIATATESAAVTYFAGSNGVTPAPFNLDDAYYAIELPFAISAYDYSSTSIRVSINGLIWLNPFSTGDYQEFYTDEKSNNLPQPGTALPDISVLPFWSDLFISEGSMNYLAYTISGSAPNRKVIFEWSVGSYRAPDDDYHFTATFTEGVMNKFSYNFISIPDSYIGTVAAQSFSDDEVLLFSRFEGKVKSGLKLAFDTTADTITEL